MKLQAHTRGEMSGQVPNQAGSQLSGLTQLNGNAPPHQMPPLGGVPRSAINMDPKGKDDGQGKKMKKKKKLRDKRKSKENSESNSNEVDPPSVRSRDGNAQSIVAKVDDQRKKMKTKKKTKADIGESPNPAPSGSPKPKRVTFSDEVDVCCDGLVRGKRFTPEEDEKIKKAVLYYIESHGLGDEGLDMILHCKSHHEIRGCWKDIASVLPHRPLTSVYNRAHVLFERGENSKWAPEELEFLLKMKEKHGSDWKSIAEALGKHRFQVKDAWREIRFINRKKGRWSQEEYQNLFDLVNKDLCVRASQGYRQSKHGMLRDNIGWEAICDKLATRSTTICCAKWYRQLTSPMVANGVWSDTDDYRLVNALFTLDASCFEEVDWDNLLERRPGDICRKRWNQMVRFIGEHGSKSFAEQVEILAKRFCPNYWKQERPLMENLWFVEVTIRVEWSFELRMYLFMIRIIRTGFYIALFRWFIVVFSYDECYQGSL